MYIILVLLIALIVAHSVEGITCPSGVGWIPYTDTTSRVTKCYKFIGDYTTNWADCAITCSLLTPGGSMLCPTSSTLNDWMWTTLTGRKDTWIGYQASDGCNIQANWKWVDTCSPDPGSLYTPLWTSGQPDDQGACAACLWGGGNGKWDNTGHGEQRYCACEAGWWSPLNPLMTAASADAVPSNDGYHGILMSTLVISVGILSIAAMLYYCTGTRSGKEIKALSEYTPINEQESG